jgi:VanZ family protein
LCYFSKKQILIKRTLSYWLAKSLPAVAWTLIIQVLLCLPGTVLPAGGFLPDVPVDKIVHFILFGGMVYLWCRYIQYNHLNKQVSLYFLLVLLIAVVNGIVMEYVQKYFIPQRSFDNLDILADTIGAVAGYLIAIKTKWPH